MEISPTYLTRFAFPCPACTYPLRGSYRGLSLDALQLEWEDASVFRSPFGEGDNQYVVTVGTTVPLRLQSRTLTEFGGAPNITFGRLIGKNANWANSYHDFFHDRIEEWKRYERLLHYYLQSDWNRFNLAGASLFRGNWRNPRNAQERHIAALRPAQLLLFPALPSAIHALLLEDYASVIIGLGQGSSFADWSLLEEQSGRLGAVHQALFGALNQYVRRWESWSAGYLVQATDPQMRSKLEKLRLCRDDFSDLRDLYVQTFEICCSALPYAAALLNQGHRGSPEIFSEVPAAILRGNAKAAPPRSIRAFAKLPNATKLQWFTEWPSWRDHIGALLDKNIRNGLGHASARHDISSGMIEFEGFSISYLELTSRSIDLGHAILALLQLVKSLRLLAADEEARRRKIADADLDRDL